MPADTNLTMWSAARQGDLEALRTLLADSPDAVHQQLADGCTPLHYAAFGGAQEAVTLLWEAGGDPNARNHTGHTPLHYAAFAGHEECFTVLVEAGADVHAVDDSLTTALHAAAASGASGIINTLLEKGIAPDVANLYGELPAHRAAQGNQLTTLQQLLQRGTTANPVDRYGMTLLHKAAIGNATETVAWLLDKGLDPLEGDIVGDTPLHSASSLGKHAVVAFLLDTGISYGLRNLDGATPLHHAASAGHIDIVELLLERGASAAAVDGLGRTPLHLAATRGHVNVVQMLLSANQEMTRLPDLTSHRPIDLAAIYGRVDVQEMLASHEEASWSGISLSSVQTFLTRRVAPGDLQAWYLGHSGWAVRTAQHLFILDYAPGEPAQASDSLLNGRVDPAEWGDLTVFVVVSHHHGDHFDRRILEWQHPNLRFVYGWDAPEDLSGFRFTNPQVKRIGDAIIASIPATDAGSAFLIEADGVSFYHAGDHAAGCQPVESAFSEGIDWLANQFAPIQAAFLPVFGCGLPSPDTLRAGNAFTIEKLRPEAAFPMHIGWTSHFYREFEEWAQQSNLNVGLGIADQPGDRFLIHNGAIEQMWT